MVDDVPYGICGAFNRSGDGLTGGTRAPPYNHLCWPVTDLMVFFMPDPLPKWGKWSKPDEILKLANIWSKAAEGNGVSVPKFVLTRNIIDSHIRVKLEGTHHM